MVISVENCLFEMEGVKRTYNMTNGSSAVERTDWPGKSRLKFYDSRGYCIRSGRSQSDMKSAVERYKTRKKIK